MPKKICRNCGKAYDVEEWVECPHCAREEYEKRKIYPKPIRYYSDEPNILPLPSRSKPFPYKKWDYWCYTSFPKINTTESARLPKITFSKEKGGWEMGYLKF